MKQYIFLFYLQLAVVTSMAQTAQGFSFVERKDQKQVDVLYKGKLLTAYCYYDSIKKPFLFPVNTLDGITITRGYPVAPRPGERTDHPHHIGLWMNYESVNGLDFWNHSTAIPYEKRNSYGTIVHQSILDKKAEGNTASITTTALWKRPDGTVLLDEQTTHVFRVQNDQFFIDRITTLKARKEPVLFKDVKDGFFAIRVARELEQPSQQQDVFIDNQGNATKLATINNEGVTGRYIASNGLTGDSVWSSQGPWTMLQGRKDGKNITVAFIDHPTNVGYPTYWHARGYGLFALNPLGRKIFSNGKEELNLTLQPGASTTFRYRVLVHSGQPLSPAQVEKASRSFAQQ